MVGDNVISVAAVGPGSIIRTYAVTVARAAADDATLSDLTLSAGTLRPGFASATKSYRAAVEHSVEQVTVTPTANAASPTIEYLDGSDAALADADSGTTGHQVALAVGLTTFKVKVTDGAETETYTVVMERDSDQTWGWTPTRDFNTLFAAGNRDLKGMWGDATTLWVSDRHGDTKLYAYTLETGVRDADKDFSLHSANSSAGDIWSDGTTMWVLDVTDRRVYAYALSGGQRQDGTEGTTNQEFSLPSGSTPSGMWMDATTLWVSDNTDDKIFAYTRADGTRVSETTGGTTTYPKDVTLSGGNNNPSGLWSDGTTIWVADSFDKVVYAYTLATGVRDADSDLDLHSENTHVNGVWQGGTTMWVIDYNDVKLYSYNAPAQAVPPSSNAAPVFPAATVTLSVAENTAANTNIGSPVAATDTDGDTLTYSLEGTDGGSFGIVSTSGQIQTKTLVTYNYEAKSSYSVTVNVNDGTVDVTKAVTISVTDVDEPPDRPAAPIVSAKSGTTDSLDVSWTAPGNTERPAIDDYNVQYRMGTTGSFTSHPFTGTGRSTTITGLNASTSYQVQVQAHNDEGDSLWSASATGNTAAPGVSVVTLNLDATTIAEDSGTAVNVTATLSAAKTTEFTVTVTAAVSPATDAAYTLSANTTLTFTANATESTGTVTITPVNNTDNERDKVITVSGAVAAGVTGVTGPADVTLTIEDDDHPVVTHTLTLHRNNAAKTLLDPTMIPENVGQVCIRVTATTEADLPPEKDSTVHRELETGYGQIPRMTTRQVSAQFFQPRSAYSLESGHHVAVRDDCTELRIVDDSVDEGNEQFTLYMTADPGYTRKHTEYEFTTSNPLTVTIIDNDEASLSIADADGAEGTDLEFTVTLDPASGREVTVDWAVDDGTATAGADYTDGSGTLTFAPGHTTKTITVATLQDTVPEGDETFTVTLSDASNAAIGDAEATGTITDDDEAAVSSDAKLRRLRLSHTNISDFDSDTTSYSVSLADSVVTVTPTANNEFAAITVNGTQVASGSDLEVDLVLGANTVTIEVTAQDGIATKTYTVTVTRHECPGQEVAGEFVTDATGCPRLTLLDTGKVRVEWDAVTSGTTVTVRYFLNFVVTKVNSDGTKEKGKWFTKSDHYSGVSDSDASLTGETFSNLPLEANVVYFSYQTDGSAWSPWSMIWIDPQ